MWIDGGVYGFFCNTWFCEINWLQLSNRMSQLNSHTSIFKLEGRYTSAGTSIQERATACWVAWCGYDHSCALLHVQNLDLPSRSWRNMAIMEGSTSLWRCIYGTENPWTLIEPHRPTSKFTVYVILVLWGDCILWTLPMDFASLGQCVSMVNVLFLMTIPWRLSGPWDFPFIMTTISKTTNWFWNLMWAMQCRNWQWTCLHSVRWLGRLQPRAKFYLDKSISKLKDKEWKNIMEVMEEEQELEYDSESDKAE